MTVRFTFPSDAHSSPSIRRSTQSTPVGVPCDASRAAAHREPQDDAKPMRDGLDDIDTLRLNSVWTEFRGCALSTLEIDAAFRKSTLHSSHAMTLRYMSPSDAPLSSSLLSVNAP